LDDAADRDLVGQVEQRELPLEDEALKDAASDLAPPQESSGRRASSVWIFPRRS
jgi:hypothetical protein